MTRKDFLKNMGIGAAFVLTVPCLHSCKGDDNGDEPAPLDVDFLVDLSDPDNATLQTPGSFRVIDKVVVARTIDGDYAAASLVCSHEATEAVTYDETEDEWFCTTHGARFQLASGDPTNNITDNDLRVYNTSLNSSTNMLRVFS